VGCYYRDFHYYHWLIFTVTIPPLNILFHHFFLILQVAYIIENVDIGDDISYAVFC